ncbi:hypothetical protein H8D04_01005 [bacterium]|nr:hypothetical protein [bacterium]
MDIRYIELGEVSKEIFTALWEYNAIIDVQIPTLIQFSLETESVILWGKHEADVSHIINSDIGNVIRTFEGASSLPENKAGYYIEGPNIDNFLLFFDKDICKMFVHSIRECCFKFGIETIWNGRNDVFFKLEENQKKFFSTGYENSFEFNINGFGITYSFNSVLANKVRDLDYKNVLKTPKFDADTGDISDVVGGIWEVNPDVNKIEFNNKFLKILMKKLGSKLKKDNLSNEEMQLLINRGKKRLEDEEWMLRGNNENFI